MSGKFQATLFRREITRNRHPDGDSVSRSFVFNPIIPRFGTLVERNLTSTFLNAFKWVGLGNIGKDHRFDDLRHAVTARHDVVRRVVDAIDGNARAVVSSANHVRGQQHLVADVTPVRDHVLLVTDGSLGATFHVSSQGHDSKKNDTNMYYTYAIYSTQK